MKAQITGQAAGADVRACGLQAPHASVLRQRAAQIEGRCLWQRDAQRLAHRGERSALQFQRALQPGRAQQGGGLAVEEQAR